MLIENNLSEYWDGKATIRKIPLNPSLQKWEVPPFEKGKLVPCQRSIFGLRAN
ncbi:hypothetical protein BGP_1850 [Beggiatoa sp. PS]|nr:hypothetical protein BGP_1850 [Beggiatoa sp. PS]